MKQSLSEGGDRGDTEPHRHHLWKIDVNAAQKNGEPQNFIQLHGDGVIGEEIEVTGCSRGHGALFPPLLETQVEDEDEEREEEDVDDAQSREDIDAQIGPETCDCDRMEGGVGGEEVSEGRGVD